MPNYPENYIYPALFHNNPKGISVSFPDLPGALTRGDTYEEAFDMARDCLALHLYALEAKSERIPLPTLFSEVIEDANDTVQLIHVWMPLVRVSQRMKARERALKKEKGD